MTSQEQALVALAAALESARVPYMVIGGQANAIWGLPRATIDIDVTVWLADRDPAELVEALAPGFVPLVQDPGGFAQQTSVVPFQTPAGLRIDVILGRLPFEEEAIRRSVSVQIGEVAVNFATAEDLILLKIVSTREQDREDVRGVVGRRRERLDLGYLEPRIQELSSLLERPEILEFWADCKAD